MNPNGGSKKCTSSKNSVPNSKRCWTVFEEQTLILGLKDIVSRMWKCENGFKTGFLDTFEQYMLQKFPGTDLKASPHIHSKIHMWRKYYGALSPMLSRSDFGWNDSNNTIDVIDDQVCLDYIKMPMPIHYGTSHGHFTKIGPTYSAKNVPPMSMPKHLLKPLMIW